MSYRYVCPVCGCVEKNVYAPFGMLCDGAGGSHRHIAAFMDLFYDKPDQAEQPAPPEQPEIDYLGAAREVSGR